MTRYDATISIPEEAAAMHDLRDLLEHPTSALHRGPRRRALRSAARLCDAVTAARRERELLRRHSFVESGVNAGLGLMARCLRLAQFTGSARRR